MQDFAALRSDAGTVMARNDIDVCCSDGIIFVSARAPDGGAGRNWATAYDALQPALTRADRGCGRTIWVAAGTYKPGPGVDDSFGIPPGVSVYGGFAGSEDPATFDVNDRSLRICRTVLSGDMEGGIRNRIVTMSSSSLLDGIVVEKGTLRGIYGSGADFVIRNCTVQQTVENGVRCINGNLTCTNCTIKSNGQGGIYFDGPGKTFTISNTFVSNSGYHGVYAFGATIDVRNSVIHNNGGRGSEYCGVRLRDISNESLIRNCTIVCNANEGISNLSSVNAGVRNCIVWYNQTSSPADVNQVAGLLDVTYSCITDPNDPGCVSHAPDGSHNIHCPPDFANPDPYFLPNFHLAAGSYCINAGLGSSFPGEMDIDADERVINGTVDMGADEVACTENLYNRADLDADGIVNFCDFAIFGNAFGGHDPNDPLLDPNVIDPNNLLRWNAVCNFNTDYFIDMKDLYFLADSWLCEACWHKMPPDPLPPFDYSISYSPGVPFEPNEPYYDPNEPEWDPNDFFSMMSMSSGGEDMSLSSAEMADPELTIHQLKETIDFLYDIIDEAPEETDNILQMIKSMYEEIELVSTANCFYDLTQ